ncbi:pseudouridine synthase [Tepidibacillus marianensis]|uniref:pseudouridine synthase n=1 Tax=Tepidibacillus marianensis TaxID=3131995 RepID=UPI0030D3DE48
MAGKKRQRLDKILSHMGFGTRKEIKQFVKEKRVTVNGAIAKDAGLQVHINHDRIEVDEDLIEYREYIYLLMNKPQGVVSATEDHHDEVVIDLLEPEHALFEPFPVGRLDKDTEGLLLLTNDGQLAHQLLSPRKHVQKTYYAMIHGIVTEEDVDQFKLGVILEDGYETLPAELKILKSGSESEIELTIYEGKFHQVKRMFEAVSKNVTFLKRLSMGQLRLDDDLEPGEYRELTEEESIQLKNANFSHERK